ncbi:9245_t:CDS:2 [Dentiscutata erythropus]|uniref:9245_t:CDS:1 n=1 Tax=Dentiscutata erythropus TaxID=1348616 RepID=A0A9N9E184_9GLOM|nr:9245_t:CDS:2 [Dentiscutata erythropus]
MLSIIFCFIVLFLLSKLFEKALDLGENKDHGTGNDTLKVEDVPEEMLDILISFVQENNKKLEWLARNKIYAEAGEVAALVEELAELIDEQQEKIARCIFHQQLYENNILIEEFMTIKKASRFKL